ncbi:TPA: ATP synthase F0 subunit A, partial [Candidatus Poribacteria bacterium]|nr:ATP synthase F0 subunit A [Candidatus Poribacteria bacterium]HEX29119.1 ATP synthase F0 subunit A [Candidatus Poribacteria bacterium]
YTPFVISFFVSILLMNLIGLVPGFISPTSNLNTTIALALIAVIGVQIIAIKEIGIWRYIKHFLGEPLWLSPLMFPLHVIGELAKVLSLSIRLFGNIFGEDTIIAVLAGMSPYFILGKVEIPYIPYQLPMMLFGLLTAFLQALVFSVLTSIYIALFIGEEEH